MGQDTSSSTGTVLFYGWYQVVPVIMHHKLQGHKTQNIKKSIFIENGNDTKFWREFPSIHDVY